MTNIVSDKIEQFILDMFGREASDVLLLNRKEIATRLDCAPSQVTYVINTRFSGSRNFSVESRRGNGGYIKITMHGTYQEEEEAEPLQEEGQQAVERERQVLQVRQAQQEQAMGDHLFSYYRMLAEYDFIDRREYELLCAMTQAFLPFCADDRQKDAAREAIQRIDTVLRNQ